MPESLLPTSKIPGYEILERLGGGGMGDVFLATQRALNRRVTITVLKPAPAADLAGLNLRCEWCADWYAPGYYGVAPLENPIGPPTGTDRIFRGGGFNSGTTIACCVFRNWTGPTTRSHATGFRVARDVTYRSRNRDSRSTFE